VNEIQVLVVDEHALMRGGIRALLERISGVKIVAEVSDGSQALHLIRQHQPHVVLVESTGSKLNAVELTARVHKECPGVHVIVLSTYADEELLRQVMNCGAAGYLTMSASPEELELAIRRVADGQTHFSCSATKLVEGFLRDRHEAIKGLTPRQREVLKLIVEGKSTKGIALELKISVKTVEAHRMLLTDRLDIHDTAGLVRYALRTRLIRLDD
jgi:DNA-binding NarL/FixJ family response regulator